MAYIISTIFRMIVLVFNDSMLVAMEPGSYCLKECYLFEKLLKLLHIHQLHHKYLTVGC